MTSARVTLMEWSVPLGPDPFFLPGKFVCRWGESLVCLPLLWHDFCLYPQG